MKRTGAIFLLAVACLLNVCCSGKKVEEDKSNAQAEAMLAGIWLNGDDETVAFKACGDTIYYTDPAIVPVHFRIYYDTIYLDGPVKMKYLIEKQGANIFQFRNQNGELVKLVKTNDPSYEAEFGKKEEPIVEVNQKYLERDTTVNAGGDTYHCFVQINPTRNKVVKSEYNDEGIKVGKEYYDNIINLTVWRGSARIYGHNFRKGDFVKYVPKEIMQNCILSDIVYDHCDETGVTMYAQLRIPESASSYVAYIKIGRNGKMRLSQPN